MRRVAQAVEARGLTVEYIRCSGDPDSLDAIWIPALRAAIADATAPHVMEPQCPGAVERYVDLGACYDIPALKAIRSELTACRAGYPECYRRAYRCLTAAAEIRGNIRALLLTPALEERMVKRARGILSRECRRSGKEPGHVTRRFLDAVSCRESGASSAPRRSSAAGSTNCATPTAWPIRSSPGCAPGRWRRGMT